MRGEHDRDGKFRASHFRNRGSAHPFMEMRNDLAFVGLDFRDGPEALLDGVAERHHLVDQRIVIHRDAVMLPHQVLDEAHLRLNGGGVEQQDARSPGNQPVPVMGLDSLLIQEAQDIRKEPGGLDFLEFSL